LILLPMKILQQNCNKQIMPLVFLKKLLVLK